MLRRSTASARDPALPTRRYHSPTLVLSHALAVVEYHDGSWVAVVRWAAGQRANDVELELDLDERIIRFVARRLSRAHIGLAPTLAF